MQKQKKRPNKTNKQKITFDKKIEIEHQSPPSSPLLQFIKSHVVFESTTRRYIGLDGSKGFVFKTRLSLASEIPLIDPTLVEMWYCVARIRSYRCNNIKHSANTLVIYIIFLKKIETNNLGFDLLLTILIY